MVRHSSHLLFASSADARAASSSCERDSSVLTCLQGESETLWQGWLIGVGDLLVAPFAERALSLPVLLCSLALAERPAARA